MELLIPVPTKPQSVEIIDFVEFSKIPAIQHQWLEACMLTDRSMKWKSSLNDCFTVNGIICELTEFLWLVLLLIILKRFKLVIKPHHKQITIWLLSCIFAEVLSLSLFLIQRPLVIESFHALQTKFCKILVDSYVCTLQLHNHWPVCIFSRWDGESKIKLMFAFVALAIGRVLQPYLSMCIA